MEMVTVFAKAGAGSGDAFAIFLFVLALFTGLIFVITSTKFVTQGYAGVIERMGKYTKTVGPGVHFIMPIFSRLIRINLKEQNDHYDPQVAITKDNMHVRVDAILFFRIIDPKKSIYDVDNYKTQVESQTISTLRNVIGGLTLSECLSSRETIDARLRAVLDENTGRMGIKVTGVQINSIDPPKDFIGAMEQEKRAEIEKNAAIMKAEGEKIAAINRAEGEKQATITRAEGEREALRAMAEGQRDASRLKAEGQAQAYRSLFEAIKAAGVDSSVLSIRYLEALEKVANGNATTLILPSDSAGVLGAVAQLAKTMSAVSAQPDLPTARTKQAVVSPKGGVAVQRTGAPLPEEPEDPTLPPA